MALLNIDRQTPLHAWDVAEFILGQFSGQIEAMKLEKLCYYAQAWSLGWNRGEIFPERFEAWENGPVIRALFARHRGQYLISTVGGNAAAVLRKPEAVATIRSIINFYGQKSGQELSKLTHDELPWKETRRLAGCEAGDACDAEIPNELMQQYYGDRYRQQVALP